MSDSTENDAAEVARVTALMRDLSDELVGRVHACDDGAAAYACGALDALVDRLSRVSPPVGMNIPNCPESHEGECAPVVLMRVAEVAERWEVAVGAILTAVAKMPPNAALDAALGTLSSAHQELSAALGGIE